MIRYTYDEANRLCLTEFLADSTSETRGYNIYGDLVTNGNGTATYTYTYDLKHRLTSKTDSRLNKSLSREYDSAGNIIRKTDYQGEATEYLYDATNRLVSQRNPAYVQVSYHYDSAGRLLDRILSNKAKTSYQYDDDNRLIGLANTSAGEQLNVSGTYTYDRVGNITSITDGSGTVNFTYDALYRLTVADYPGTADDKAYTYDAVGNRTILTDATETLHYLYNNDGNRLDEIRQGSVSGAIVIRYVYDDNGNRIEKRDGADVLLQGCAYDQKNRMSTLTGSGPVLTFQYDPNDYRIEKDDVYHPGRSCTTCTNAIRQQRYDIFYCRLNPKKRD